MGADGPDREQLVAAPSKQRRFAMGVTGQRGAVGNGRERDALREVRPAQFG
jgi:hypothetical protein